MTPPLLLFLLALQDPRAVEGFAIAKAADSTFPMFACLDDRGRLYVTESSGGDLYLELQKLTRGCRVRRFEDKDGDGTYETSTLFAENLTPSMGLAWRDGKLYVADPPDLAVLEDSDGDGKADRRTVLLSGFGHKDNGSLHGIAFGPDGNLYFTMGDPDGFKLRGPDGSTAEGRTGGLLRCRPDGSRLEVLCLGFENLVEVVFLPGGEIIGTDNWFQLPTGGIRDALVHLLPGGVYPRHHETRHAPLVRTGDPLPALSLYPAVALSGLVRYSGSSFPDMYGMLFSAQHNSRKVQRHALESSGHTFTTTDHEFVWSDNPDFHPSDVLQAPDGSLLVVDTGAWYVQHCPTGKIRNSRAPGGIWRVTSRRGRPPEVRRAIEETERGWASKWKRAFEPGEEPLKELIALLETADGRLAAHALAIRGDRAAGPALVRQLEKGGATFRLSAAVALASCGTPEALPALWEALEGPMDAHLEHAIVYAVHRIADRPTLEKAVDDPNPRVQKAALVLLDQRGGAPQEAVLRRVGAADPALRRAAIGILQKHKEWAAGAIGLVKDWLKKKDLSEDDRQALRGSILAFQADAGVQGAVAGALAEKGPLSPLLLGTIAETTLPKFPAAWREALRSALPSAEAIRTLTVLGLPDFDDALSGIIDGTGPTRLMALRAIVGRRPKLSERSLFFLIEELRAESPLEQLTAAEVLSRARFTDGHAALAIRAVRGNALISPGLFLAQPHEPVDPEGLLEAITEAVRAGWKPSEAEIELALNRFPPAVREKAGPLRELVRAGAGGQREKLEKAQPLLSGGDATRGRAVFFGRKVACGACHAIGSEGGRIGPDLTKVGAIRSGRDLLESILVPGSTFAQGYEPYVVATSDGDVVPGLIARQDAEAVVLRDAAGAETRIRRDRIREMKRGTTSIMPEGLERNLSEQEFRDLLAFLQGLR